MRRGRLSAVTPTRGGGCLTGVMRRSKIKGEIRVGTGGSRGNGQWRRMISRFRRHKLIAVRDGVLTALVGFGCGSAFAFKAAIRGLLARCSSREAVERSHEQNNCDQCDRNVNATPHSNPVTNTNASWTAPGGPWPAPALPRGAGSIGRFKVSQRPPSPFSRVMPPA